MKRTFKNLFAMMVFAGLMVACGDDDETPPPPMVDCNATGPSVSATPTASVCGEDDGQVALTITGGTGQLTVALDPTPMGLNFDGATATFTDVQPGTYTVEVTDEDNCVATASVTVDFSAGNLSYANDIDAIIQNSCAIANCHDGTQPDFSDFATFQARAQDLGPGGVRARVKSGDMPRSGSLSAEEIAAILCWVDEGAQDN